MKKLNKTNVNSIKLTELNNGYSYRLKSKLNYEYLIYKEFNMIHIKQFRPDGSILDWICFEKFKTIKDFFNNPIL